VKEPASKAGIELFLSVKDAYNPQRPSYFFLSQFILSINGPSSYKFAHIHFKGAVLKFAFFILSFSAGLISFTVGFPTEAIAAPTVVTRTMKKIELNDSLSYPARMESKVNASIYSDTEGVVTRISKHLGEKIRRGDALVTIRHTDPIYQYAPMIATSPVSGVVSQIRVTEGTRVPQGELLATVTDPAKIRIVIEVAALDLKSLSIGALGDFKISGRTEPLPVRIRGLSPSVDSATGTATAELEFTTPVTKDLAVTPGIVGQVNFKVNKRMGFLIPEHALTYKANETFVRVVQENKGKKVAVVIGQKQRGQVEILSGISEGDALIERASGFIADGEEVKVEKNE
jgi:multidrug efflux pump subunit AcrA (membrane-fusion protein)